MNNFVDVLIEECKKKVEQATGTKCDDATAWEELHNIFKKAQISRSNKSKILDKYKNNPNFKVSRGFAIALGIAFEFKITEMNEFLSKAGFFLSDYHLEDTIIIDLISTKNYNVNAANEALEENGFQALTYRMSKKDLPKEYPHRLHLKVH